MQLREVRATARNPNPPAFVGVQGSPSTEHGTKGEEQTNKIGFSNTGSFSTSSNMITTRPGDGHLLRIVGDNPSRARLIPQSSPH